MSTDFEEIEVQRALYTGSVGGFDAFLRQLARLTRASGAVLALGDEARWSHGDPPGLPPAPAMREGRVYAQGDLPGSGHADPPLRMVAAARAVRLAVHRTHDDFRATDSALISRLVPHLETAVMLWRQRQDGSRRAALDARVAGALGGGWLLFDATLRVNDASPGAAALLARAGAGLTADGRLTLSDHDRALRRAVDGALAGTLASLVTLSTAPLVEMVVRPEAGQALALIRAAPEARALSALAEGLGLTRSEARLVAELIDGASLSEAALALGWSEQTARSTSKEVYSKLGVSGQSALLRRILNGALWLMEQKARPFEQT